MAQIQSAGTCFSDGVRTGPLFQDQEDRRAAPYMGSGPGMAYSTQYSYFFTPWPSPTGTASTGVPAYDVVSLISVNTPSATYLTITNDNYPLSTQFVNSKTGRPGLQFDYPRCLGFYIGDSPQVGQEYYINFIGEDLYGFPMLEKITLTEDDEEGTYFTNKAFYRLYDVYVSTNDDEGIAVDIAVRTANRFGLPYRLYSSANIIALGAGPQAVSVGATSEAILIDNTKTNSIVSQGYFYNLEYLRATAAALASYTGGPLHNSQSLDVRGILDFDVTNALSPNAFQTNAPVSICFTYVVLGFDNYLNREYEAKDRYNYNPEGTPDHDIYFPNSLPILPNCFLNYPAGAAAPYAGKSNVPAKLPLNLTTAFGVPQFYTESRGDV